MGYIIKTFLRENESFCRFRIPRFLSKKTRLAIAKRVSNFFKRGNQLAQLNIAFVDIYGI